jgi:hypothetical protein
MLHRMVLDAWCALHVAGVHVACAFIRFAPLLGLPQDSLGGNARTLAIVCVSPLRRDYAPTLASLR